jgi:hypothetical protein
MKIENNTPELKKIANVTPIMVRREQNLAIVPLPS